MFWADEIAEKVKGNQIITDGKTPSGRIHVGSLRGVLIHDAIFRSLKSKGKPAAFSYIFDDFDAFDEVPSWVNKKEFGEHIGKPLRNVPSPDSSKNSFAEYFAYEFMEVFKYAGVEVEILWQTELHKKGLLDEAIKIALDNGEKIQDIYQKVSGSKKREAGWFPFQPICQECGKIGTTKATGWDGKVVIYECKVDLVAWAKGCGYKGKVSPFGGNGKLP